VPAAPPSLREELNGAEKGGPEHDAQIFGEVTDLFLSNFDRLSESQIAAVDGVLAQLVERVAAASLVELSEELSTIEQAPRQTVRNLALHADVEVAGPVLRHSPCLSEDDLIEVARSRGQQHLLAISDRKVLNEALTDALMRFGDVNVSNALARNAGARFSECGYATLVGRAERDEALAEKLGVRLDIPGTLLRELIGKVADVVRARFLTASRPIARKKVQGAAGAAPSATPRKAIDYTKAQNEVVTLNRTGKLNGARRIRSCGCRHRLEGRRQGRGDRALPRARAGVRPDRRLQGGAADVVDDDDDRPQPPGLPAGHRPRARTMRRDL
jgi:uncharacterized protein (DUF2336 family)